MAKADDGNGCASGRWSRAEGLGFSTRDWDVGFRELSQVLQKRSAFGLELGTLAVSALMLGQAFRVLTSSFGQTWRHKKS